MPERDAKVRLQVRAPPGKLGIALTTDRRGGVIIHSVQDTSPMAGKLSVRDAVIGVDEIDTAQFAAKQLAALLVSRDSSERLLTITLPQAVPERIPVYSHSKQRRSRKPPLEDMESKDDEWMATEHPKSDERAPAIVDDGASQQTCGGFVLCPAGPCCLQGDNGFFTDGPGQHMRMHIEDRERECAEESAWELFECA